MKILRFLFISAFVFTATSGALTAKFNEKAAIAILASDSENKARACQALAVHGGPDSVPALAELLGDKKLASYARTALEVIDDPSAGEALRAALSSIKGRLLAGVVTSLGVRGDKEAIPALQELTSSPNKQVAESALVALARIGTEDGLATVIQALNQGPADLRIAAAHAALLAAEMKAHQGDKTAAQKLKESVRNAVVPEHIKQAAM